MNEGDREPVSSMTEYYSEYNYSQIKAYIVKTSCLVPASMTPYACGIPTCSIL